ncbi:MAG: hypothetical protein SOZ40_05160 [Ezakiella sp.]|nr:hypothetical protein [Ezakiella sp.]MDD7761588.1 hypothetical protein [Bacillota bacterium]MDY3947354.1 hypothetical protein [Ezakiella sp.]
MDSLSTLLATTSNSFYLNINNILKISAVIIKIALLYMIYAELKKRKRG